MARGVPQARHELAPPRRTGRPRRLTGGGRLVAHALHRRPASTSPLPPDDRPAHPEAPPGSWRAGWCLSRHLRSTTAARRRRCAVPAKGVPTTSATPEGGQRAGRSWRVASVGLGRARPVVTNGTAVAAALTPPAIARLGPTHRLLAHTQQPGRPSRPAPPAGSAGHQTHPATRGDIRSRTAARRGERPASLVVPRRDVDHGTIR